jgi:hypothetical protein
MDPLAWLRRRGRFVPATDCDVEFGLAGLLARRRVDVLVINRDHVLSVQPPAPGGAVDAPGREIEARP